MCRQRRQRHLACADAGGRALQGMRQCPDHGRVAGPHPRQQQRRLAVEKLQDFNRPELCLQEQAV